MKHRSTFALCALIVCLTARADLAEPALAMAATDARIKWGPCPDFMPKGCQLAAVHGDPAKDNADVLLKIPAGSRIPDHRHTSAERMVLIAGELQVTYEGQPAATLKPGMYAYGPAQRAHSGACAAGEDCVLFIAFESPVDAVATDKHPR